MIYKMYSVFDKKALSYTSPICVVNDAVATRLFGSMCEQEKAESKTQDLELYCVGEFNGERGVIVNAYEKPVYICSALDMLNGGVINE